MCPQVSLNAIATNSTFRIIAQVLDAGVNVTKAGVGEQHSVARGHVRVWCSTQLLWWMLNVWCGAKLL